MASLLPFARVDRRTAWLRAVLLSACFLSMLACLPLWLNSRMFPLLPITPWFPVLPTPWDKYFLGAMLLSLLLAGWFYRTAVLCFLLGSLFLFLEDQNRGQAWFYMYWVMLWLTLLPQAASIAACQWAFSVVYVWSGIQKLNATFFQRMPVWFVSSATHWHLPALVVELFRWSVAAAPFIEIFIGFALWMPRLRKPALGAIVTLHVMVLLFLGPLGLNYNLTVWPWNIAMIALAFTLFTGPANEQLRRSFSELRRSKAGLAVVALYCFLPILSYAGCWDSYFSFSLFAEHEARADIFITQSLGERLPDELHPYVHRLQQAYNPRIQGPYVFDYKVWGFKELNSPPIAEPRNYRSIFHFLQIYATDPADLRLVVSPRAGPMVFYEGDNSQLIIAK